MWLESRRGPGIMSVSEGSVLVVSCIYGGKCLLCLSTAAFYIVCIFFKFCLSDFLKKSCSAWEKNRKLPGRSEYMQSISNLEEK